MTAKSPVVPEGHQASRGSPGARSWPADPIGTADGVVARAAARLTMVATGLDPKSFSVPEVAFFRRVPRCLEAAEGFAGGTPEGVRAWLRFCCEALEAGAREAKSISDAAT